MKQRDFFAETDILLKELSSRRPLSPSELERLRKEFVTEYTYNSNAIEGNTLTLRETSLVLEGVTVSEKPLREHLEAVGHRDAFEYITELVKEKAEFTPFVMREIHSLVLIDKPEAKGRFRRIPVRISGSDHVPPEFTNVPELVDKLIESYNASDAHPIEKASIFHCGFENIHPFGDGNGRAGRLILNMMLMQAGYPPISVKFSDVKRYYAAFERYDSTGDPDPMTDLVTEYVKEQMRRMIKIIDDANSF